MTQVTSERETKWEERERVIARWVLSSNCNNGESLTQLHCFLYHCQLSPPLSPFHWMKFPTSCLFKLSPILSFQRSLPPSPIAFFFLLSITHFARCHFFSEKHRSYQNTVPVWNWTLFFLVMNCTLKRHFSSLSSIFPGFVWVMRINSGTEGRVETDTGDYFIYSFTLSHSFQVQAHRLPRHFFFRLCSPTIFPAMVSWWR